LVLVLVKVMKFISGVVSLT